MVDGPSEIRNWALFTFSTLLLVGTMNSRFASGTVFLAMPQDWCLRCHASVEACFGRLVFAASFHREREQKDAAGLFSSQDPRWGHEKCHRSPRQQASVGFFWRWQGTGLPCDGQGCREAPDAERAHGSLQYQQDPSSWNLGEAFHPNPETYEALDPRAHKATNA